MSKKHSLSYTVHFTPDAKNNKASIYLLGNQGRIFGYNEDDYNSNDLLLNSVEQQNPKAIILGNLAYTDMNYLRFGDMKYTEKPIIEEVQAEQTIARKKLAKFIIDELPNNLKQVNRIYL